jgi:hypothetical protein
LRTPIPCRDLRAARHEVQKLRIRLANDVTVQTKGYDGAGCLRVSRFLEQALGTPSSERKTAEFYKAEAQEQTITQTPRISKTQALSQEAM